MNAELFRRIGWWLAGEITVEIFPAALTGLFCLLHDRPFPVEHLVAFSLFPMLAGSLFTIAIFHVWADGIRIAELGRGMPTMTLILTGLLLVIIVAGYQTDFLVKEALLSRPGPGHWLAFQIVASAIVLVFTLFIKTRAWCVEQQRNHLPGKLAHDVENL